MSFISEQINIDKSRVIAFISYSMADYSIRPPLSAKDFSLSPTDHLVPSKFVRLVELNRDFDGS